MSVFKVTMFVYLESIKTSETFYLLGPEYNGRQIEVLLNIQEEVIDGARQEITKNNWNQIV